MYRGSIGEVVNPRVASRRGGSIPSDDTIAPRDFLIRRAI